MCPSGLYTYGSTSVAVAKPSSTAAKTAKITTSDDCMVRVKANLKIEETKKKRN